jgi:membrane protease YdiL (CAAX protease family)
MAASPAPKDGVENPVFGFLEVLLVLLFGVVSLVFSIVVVFTGMWIAGRHVDLSSDALSGNGPLFVGIQTLAYLWLIAFMIALVRMKHDTPFFTAISWNMPGAKMALGALVAGAALALVSGIVSDLLAPWAPKSVPIEAFFRTRNSIYAMIFFGIAVAPFMEELFFRGFLYPVLARNLGILPSVALTGAAFALLHEGQLAHAWVPLLVLFIVGTALTAVRAWTRSVATGLLIHIGYNTTLFAVLFVATDGFRHLDKV